MSEHLNDPGIYQVAGALGVLREASAGKRAPEHVEASVLQAFRGEHQRIGAAKANRIRRFAWVAGAVAASLIVAAALRLSKPEVVNAPVVAKAPAVHPPVVEVRAEPKRAVQPVRRRVRPRRQPSVLNAGVPASRELTTDFF